MTSKGQRRRKKETVARYSAKLLFQFRVVVNGDSGARRLCEERMIVFRAASPRLALAAGQASRTRRSAPVQEQRRRSRAL
jgi:hypothetical protein